MAREPGSRRTQEDPSPRASGGGTALQPLISDFSCQHGRGPAHGHCRGGHRNHPPPWPHHSLLPGCVCPSSCLSRAPSVPCQDLLPAGTPPLASQLPLPPTRELPSQPGASSLHPGLACCGSRGPSSRALPWCPRGFPSENAQVFSFGTTGQSPSGLHSGCRPGQGSEKSCKMTALCSRKSTRTRPGQRASPAGLASQPPQWTSLQG